MHRYRKFLLLSTLICHTASLSLPETLNSSSNSTNLPNAQAVCTGFKLFQLRPLHRDCMRAIDLLSSSQLPGYFHIGGVMDDWQLPVTETVDTCELSVQLNPYSLPEHSSWRTLKLAAGRLGDDCKDQAVWGDITGGTITSGPHDRIVIEMVRSKGAEAVGG